MSSISILKALGLNLSPNQLSVEEGSLIEAKNIIIRRDNVIESRRGFKLYGDAFGTSTDTAKQLLVYKDRILRHYQNVLQFDDGTGLFTNFNGSYSEQDSGLRIKSIQANDNLYFTTSNGIKKISAKNADNFSSSSGYITQAGGIKAVDLTSRLNITLGDQSSFFTQDSAVAYRTVWAKKDANENLILGSPSTRSEIYNSLLTLLINDFLNLLGKLDDINQSGSLITDGNYVNTLKLPINSSADTLRTNLLSLVSKIDNDILYANDTGTGAPLTISSASISSGVCTVTFSGGTVTDYFSIGSKIYLSGFSTGTGSINGGQTVTGVTGTTITFNTSATGAVLVTSTSIVSNEYRSITQPGVPSLPATNAQLVDIQNYISNIILQLKAEPTAVISNSLMTGYINSLAITSSSTVILNITVPSGITTDYFLQVYRSSLITATGTDVLADLVPDDEMRLVYEAYLTSAQIADGKVVVEDITLDDFRGANLYTNPISGEGILQSNDLPPFAKDINRFKNVIFYANTKTRHRKNLALLGVQDLINDYNNSIIPKLTISDGTTTNTYSFVIGRKEVTNITCVADIANSLNGKYFTINSANDETEYYVWFKTSGGVETDPAISGKTGLKVNIATNSTATQVADAVRDVLSRQVLDFTVSSSTSTVIVTNVQEGYTTNAVANTSGFTISVTTEGRGESASNKEILLSSLTSPASAVDETARSIVRVINKNSNEIVYAYYLSSGTDVPGQFLLEARTLSDSPIYFLTNNSNTGDSFNPALSPEQTITGISVANPTVITSTSHGLNTGDKIIICNSNSTPSIDGLYEIKYASANTFTIPVNVTSIGSSAVFTKAINAEVTENEQKSNRVYYSKLQQPEAVPITNYFDVGSENKQIHRIFPLRDSLFVFKEDGLYRISGESAPFTISLFDSSFILVAPDSLSVSNNVIYGFTSQGIQGLTESGATIISRPIDTEILKLSSSSYTNFRTATWGIGYENDNAYLLWTVKQTTDDVATICYRYSNLTGSWTIFDKKNTCGIINSADDKMYLGAGDVNYIEQERKSFTRLDYTDREYETNLLSGTYFNSVLQTMQLNDVSKISKGDVLIQTQKLSPYIFNNLLLKLDADNGLNDSDYYSSLQSIGGDNIRTKLENLANKIDSDTGPSDNNYYSTIQSKSGSITNIAISTSAIITSNNHGLFSGRKVTISGSNCTPSIDGNYEVTVIDSNTFIVPVNVTISGTAGSWLTLDNDFDDIKNCYNTIINKLNLDSNVYYNNYLAINGETLVEAIVTNVEPFSKKITLNQSLDFIVGPLTIYKAIESSFTYAPITFGDPVNMKHISEATVMFNNKAFTNATLSFASDLLPKFNDVPFNGDGNGIFGLGTGNFGNGFFGGNSHAAPFRTYVPRNNQRCRYLLVKFTHKVAREKYELFGITLTGNNLNSSRAYR